MQKMISASAAFAYVLAFAPFARAQGAATAAAAMSNSVGYAAEFTATIQMGSQEPRVVYRETRWVASSGNWRSIQDHSNGRNVEKFAEVGRGVFLVDEKEKKLIRLGSPWRPTSTQGAYLRSERLLGLDTDVFEIVIPDGSVLLYHSRQLNGDIVKVVRRGPKDVFTLQVSRIVVGEPDPVLLRHSEYPVVDRPG